MGRPGQRATAGDRRDDTEHRTGLPEPGGRTSRHARDRRPRAASHSVRGRRYRSLTVRNMSGCARSARQSRHISGSSPESGQAGRAAARVGPRPDQRRWLRSRTNSSRSPSSSRSHMVVTTCSAPTIAHAQVFAPSGSRPTPARAALNAVDHRRRRSVDEAPERLGSGCRGIHEQEEVAVRFDSDHVPTDGSFERRQGIGGRLAGRAHRAVDLIDQRLGQRRDEGGLVADRAVENWLGDRRARGDVVHRGVGALCPDHIGSGRKQLGAIRDDLAPFGSSGPSSTATRDSHREKIYSK